MDLISCRENRTSSQQRRPARSCSQKSKTRKILPLSLLYCVAGGRRATELHILYLGLTFAAAHLHKVNHILVVEELKNANLSQSCHGELHGAQQISSESSVSFRHSPLPSHSPYGPSSEQLSFHSLDHEPCTPPCVMTDSITSQLTNPLHSPKCPLSNLCQLFILCYVWTKGNTHSRSFYRPSTSSSRWPRVRGRRHFYLDFFLVPSVT